MQLLFLLPVILTVCSRAEARPSFNRPLYYDARQYCDRNDIRNVNRVVCEKITEADLQHCFSKHQDRTTAALLRQCGSKINNTQLLKHMADDFAQNSQIESFGQLLKAKTCNWLTEDDRVFLAEKAIDANHVQILRLIRAHCVISTDKLHMLKARAEKQPKKQALLAALGDLTQATIQHARKGTKKQLAPSHQHLDATTMGMAHGKHRKEGKKAKRIAMYGTLTHEKCQSITRQCLQEATVAYMQGITADCLGAIPAPELVGLTRQAAKAITCSSWSGISAAQMSHIKAKVVTAIPWKCVGESARRTRKDSKHPCSGVTAEQRQKLQKKKSVFKQYKARCSSAAAAINGSSSWLIIALVVITVSL